MVQDMLKQSNYYPTRLAKNPGRRVPSAQDILPPSSHLGRPSEQGGMADGLGADPSLHTGATPLAHVGREPSAQAGFL